MGVALDADLALAEIEIASGQAVDRRARLEAVERQARANGFLLLANQAATARR
jgi:hypothetical protein